jgi:pre-rRNA-processing protein IPI1
LTKLLPLTSDGHASVRSQLAKLLKALPPAEIVPHVEKISMYIRAGLTHLSTDIRDDSLNLLEWILDIAPLTLVSCPGGWLKLMATFGVLLGWKPEDSTIKITTAVPGAKGWTAASTAALGATKGGALRAHQVQLLAKFLEAGLRPEPPVPLNPRDYWNNLYRLPRQPNPFVYLNLFGTPREGDSEMYADRRARQRVFGTKWYTAVMRGMEEAKKEGGAVGRAASELDRALLDGMDDFEDLQQHV